MGRDPAVSHSAANPFPTTSTAGLSGMQTEKTKMLRHFRTSPRAMLAQVSLVPALAVPILAASVSLAPAPLVAETLTDALISAYRNSPELKAARASLRGTDEDVAQARAARRPTLGAQASAGVNHSFAFNRDSRFATLNLAASLTLWDGGTTDLAIRSARAGVRVGRVNLIDTEQQVLLAAITAYMDMRRDKKLLQLARTSFEVAAQQLKATRDRFEVGEVRRTDVSQVEARKALAQSVVALRQGTLEISREAYHVAVGRYPGRLAPPPPLPALPKTRDAARALALKNHPAIQRARIMVEIADLNVARARAAMKPRIALQGNLAINANAPTGDTAGVSITGSVPIYQGGSLSSALRKARELAQKARFDLQRAGQLVTQGVNRSWSQLAIARATITARRKEVESAQVALNGIRDEASLGTRTALDVLDAEKVLFEARTNLATARHDEEIAAYGLLSATGLLTARHLGLGVRVYDPAIHYRKVEKAPGPSDRGRLLDRILRRAGGN